MRWDNDRTYWEWRPNGCCTAVCLALGKPNDRPSDGDDVTVTTTRTSYLFRRKSVWMAMMGRVVMMIMIMTDQTTVLMLLVHHIPRVSGSPLHCFPSSVIGRLMRLSSTTSSSPSLFRAFFFPASILCELPHILLYDDCCLMFNIFHAGLVCH